jgi:hypothetical protein
MSRQSRICSIRSKVRFHPAGTPHRLVHRRGRGGVGMRGQAARCASWVEREASDACHRPKRWCRRSTIARRSGHPWANSSRARLVPPRDASSARRTCPGLIAETVVTVGTTADQTEPRIAAARKVARLLGDLQAYVSGRSAIIIDYAAARRREGSISTTITESTVGWRCMCGRPLGCKRQDEKFDGRVDCDHVSGLVDAA